MALVFDTAARRIILDTANITAGELWSRWCDWSAQGDNSKWPAAFRQVGGDDLGGGLSIPAYYFLLNGWRVRPMEASHLLVITGNLFVDGGAAPVVNTLGAFNVSTQYTVPVQAQAVATGGGSSGPSASQVAAEVRLALASELARVLEIAQIHGLVQGSPLVVTETTRTAGDIVQSLATTGSETTVSRV